MNFDVSEVSRQILWELFEKNQPQKLAQKVFELARRDQDVMRSFALHPLEDEWLDFARESMNAHVERCKGFVYAAANPVHVDLHKVGQTGKTVEARLKALVVAGVFGHFEVVHTIRVPDRFRAETRVHHRLAGVDRHKEFFKTPHQNVAAAMDFVHLEELMLLTRLGLKPLSET